MVLPLSPFSKANPFLFASIPPLKSVQSSFPQGKVEYKARSILEALYSMRYTKIQITDTLLNAFGLGGMRAVIWIVLLLGLLLMAVSTQGALACLFEGFETIYIQVRLLSSIRSLVERYSHDLFRFKRYGV